MARHLALVPQLLAAFRRLHSALQQKGRPPFTEMSLSFCGTHKEVEAQRLCLPRKGDWEVNLESSTAALLEGNLNRLFLAEEILIKPQDATDMVENGGCTARVSGSHLGGYYIDRFAGKAPREIYHCVGKGDRAAAEAEAGGLLLLATALAQDGRIAQLLADQGLCAALLDIARWLLRPDGGGALDLKYI